MYYAGSKHLRQVAGGLVGGLGDNKKPMRDATVAALTMAITLNRHNTNTATTTAPSGAGADVLSSVVEVGWGSLETLDWPILIF